jgi:hypothetical protein
VAASPTARPNGAGLFGTEAGGCPELTGPGTGVVGNEEANAGDAESPTSKAAAGSATTTAPRLPTTNLPN